MAKVFRKKKNGKQLPNWYCTFQIPTKEGGSEQIQRSTHCTKKREAEKKAIQLEEEARREAGCDDPAAAAILARIKEAAELALKGRLNPAHARRLIGEIMEASGQGALKEQSCRDWIDEWLREKEATVKPATVAFYKSTTKDFLNFLEGRADNHLETVSQEDIRRYRDSIVANGRTGKTANHKLKCVRSIFRDAVKASLIIHNPADAVKQVKEDDSTSREPFTVREIERLISAATSADWKGMILLGAFAGIRISDCAQLMAGNIDLTRKIIRFKPRKTDRKGQILEIPLHPELLTYFERNPPSPFDATPLFPKLNKVTASGRNGLSARFRRIMKDAEVSRDVTRTAEDGAARETASRSFHSLRHSFTSMLANAQVSEEVRQKMTGHTESTTHQLYTHLELKTLRKAVNFIPRLGK